jgi:hypothetical protein
MTLLSLLVSALGSTVVQLPYPLTIHFILAGPKRDPWKPQFDERLWPKGIKLRVNIILDTSEATNLRWPRCTNEAATYLRGIEIVYRSLKPHDIVAFMHAHDTSWHADTPMEKQWLKLLNSGDYIFDEPFGSIYCFNNKLWAANQLVTGSKPVSWWWNLMFKDTNWQKEPIDIDSLAYSCCATFFVSGELLLRHSIAEYQRVQANLLAACNRSELFPPAYPGPVGRLMEGTWHFMLANVTKVLPPPFCPGNGARSNKPLLTDRRPLPRAAYETGKRSNKSLALLRDQHAQPFIKMRVHTL